MNNESNINLGRLKEFYSSMFLIRYVENTLLNLFSRGVLNGTVHTCIGQEACAVGVVSALRKDLDIIFSNHRGHGHYLTYSNGDVLGLIGEIMGKRGGVCGGVGGSQHLQLRNFYTNGIQGAGVPIVAGMALAEKNKASGAVSVCFIGDGTFGEGIIYETFNIASLWVLPMLIVVEHNQYAQSTHSSLQHAGDLETRLDSYGVKVNIEDGMDVIKVYETSLKILNEIRSNLKPQVLFLNTYRFSPHSKGDDYRDPAEIEKYKLRDPILLLKNIIGDDLVNQIDKQIIYDVDKIVQELIT